MEDIKEPVVLITGSSGGIGDATARMLAAEGWHVLATARRLASLRPLEERAAREGWKITAMPLDVTDSGSIRQAVASARVRAGRIDALINNAGFGQYGPSESVAIDAVRRQFETNVFGLLELTQQVIPLMRDQGRGRIVNVSSLGGRVSVLFSGVYCASKFALEALSDALRQELGVFGIDVIVIEPGPTKTNFAETSIALVETIRSDPRSPYKPFLPAIEEVMARYRYDGVSADDVARVIRRSLRARRPRARYQVGMAVRALDMLARVLPARVIDALVQRQFRYDASALDRAAPVPDLDRPAESAG